MSSLKRNNITTIFSCSLIWLAAHYFDIHYHKFCSLPFITLTFFGHGKIIVQHITLYIYIYIYIRVCVCVFSINVQL